MARNIQLIIAYDGTDFQGWQKQKNGPTIQAAIEDKLSIITESTIQLHGAGRTDAGVHALGMSAHFITDSTLSCAACCKALNALLAPTIRILAAHEMPLDFHARFSAKGKRYEYQFITSTTLLPFERLYSLHQTRQLNWSRIRSCLRHLVGTHDFSSFENTGSRDKDYPSRKGAVRTLFTAELEQRSADSWRFVFVGDGFLRNMVRNMVGTLLEAGLGKITENEFLEILKGCDRTLAGPTAPAHGLFLMEVLY